MEKNQKQKVTWTEADRLRHQAIRTRFQRQQPALEDLVASGEFNQPILQGAYLSQVQLIGALQEERERQGMTLADVGRRAGLVQAALRKLEKGQVINPTFDTLYRYAAVLGKHLRWDLQDLPGTNADPNGQPVRTKKKGAQKKV